MKGKAGLIVGGVTFTIFMTEAIIHYNVGAKTENPARKFGIPPINRLFNMALIVGTASLVSSLIVSVLIKNQ